MSKLLTTRQAGALLGVGTYAVRWAVRQGSLKALRNQHGHLLFEEAEVLRWKSCKGKGHRGKEYIEYPPALDKEGWDEFCRMGREISYSEKVRGPGIGMDYDSLLQHPFEEGLCDEGTL